MFGRVLLPFSAIHLLPWKSCQRPCCSQTVRLFTAPSLGACSPSLHLRSAPSAMRGTRDTLIGLPQPLGTALQVLSRLGVDSFEFPVMHKKGKGGGPRGGQAGGWRRLPKRLGAVTVGYKCH